MLDRKRPRPLTEKQISIIEGAYGNDQTLDAERIRGLIATIRAQSKIIKELERGIETLTHNSGGGW